MCNGNCGGNCYRSCESNSQCPKKASHQHDGKDIYYGCRTDLMKKYGFKNKMNYDDIIESLLNIIDGQQKALGSLKESYRELLDGDASILYIQTGASKPIGEFAKGAYLIENSTGDQSASDGVLYMWTGVTWTQVSN